MHIGPREFARWIFSAFLASSTKSKMAPKFCCHSLELELLHGFVSCLVQKNNLTLHVCRLVFLCDYDNKTYIFYFLWFYLIFQFCSFWLSLLSKYGNMGVQLKFYLLGMLSGLEKIVRRIVFLFSFFQQNSRWLTNHMLLSRVCLLHRFVPRKQLTLAIIR